MTHADLDALKAAHPVADVAAQYVRLRRAGAKLIGPCPVCGGSARNGRFEVDPRAESWVCAVCQDGGDVISLVQRVEGLDFRGAVDRLGGTAHESEASRARREAVQSQRRERQARDAERFREAERRRVHKTWAAGVPIREGSPVAAYLAARRIEVPPRAHLRMIGDAALYGPNGADGRPMVLHRGPAMLAAVIGPDGRFGALHTTWVDPAAPGRKIEVADPETGELAPAKKVRGSKKAGRIELVRVADPLRLFIGEGIETVLSVWMALRQLGSGQLDRAAFWTSVDLGNLGGPAAETVPHPTDKTPHGRPKRIPGPVPDWSEPAIPIPETVREVVLLGDGDSDPFLTRMTLQRAAARWASPGRRIWAAMAPSGADFNDMWRAA